MITAIFLSFIIFCMFIVAISLIFYKKQLKIKISTSIGLILIIILYFINAFCVIPIYFAFEEIVGRITGVDVVYGVINLAELITMSLILSFVYSVGWLIWLFNYKKNSLLLLLCIIVMSFMQCFVFYYYGWG